jgi:hypothetical protein
MERENEPKHNDLSKPATREFLSKRLYKRWISLTYYSFAVTLVIILVVVLKTSFTINQEQLTAFATTSGVFAGLALAVAPLIPQNTPNDYGRRSFLLLALTFVLTTILLLFAKIEVGEKSAVSLYIFSAIFLSATAVVTPTLRRRIKSFEFYVEVVLVVIPLTPSFDLLTASLILFILGDLQLIWLLFLASSAAFVRSDDDVRHETVEKVKDSVEQLLEEKISKALSFDEIMRDLASKGQSLSPSSLRTILEEMDHETLSSKPRLAMVKYESYVPLWKGIYVDRLLNWLPPFLSTSTGSTRDVNRELAEQLAKPSGLSPELISQYAYLDSIIQNYEKISESYLKTLYVKRNELEALRLRFREMGDSVIESQHDLEEMFDNFDIATKSSLALKNNGEFVKIFLDQEENALSRLEDNSAKYLVQILFKHDEGHLLKRASGLIRKLKKGGNEEFKIVKKLTDEYSYSALAGSVTEEEIRRTRTEIKEATDSYKGSSERSKLEEAIFDRLLKNAIREFVMQLIDKIPNDNSGR